MSKYQDDLREAFNIYNEWDLSKKRQCPLIVFRTQHPHAFGWKQHRSDVYFIRDGKDLKRTEPIRLHGHHTLNESREAHRDAAIEWARKKGIWDGEWAPSGFPNSWIPKPVKDQIMQDLKDWRRQKAQK